MKAITGVRPPSGFFKNNRQRLVQALKAKTNCNDDSYILLKGNRPTMIYDDDQEYHFVQDSHFWWCTGVDQPRCHALIKVGDGSVHIFCEKQPDFLKYWMKILELPEYQENFEIDSIHYDSDIEAFVKEQQPSVIYITGEGINSYSGVGPLCPEFEWFSNFVINRGALYNIINEVKVRKSQEEVELMKNSAKICQNAHVFVMKNIKPGMNEVHVQTLFRFQSRFYDYAAYSPYIEICATGSNGAILHYNNNDAITKDGDMFLMDAGVQLNGYASDITSTFPVNGKFSEKQASIYNIVLKANRDVIAALKPGINWQELHNLSERSILGGLKELGFFTGDASVEDLWNDRIIYYFYPHGLGHYIGTYVHDLKGDPNFEGQKKQIPKQNIRFTRVLEEGMCVTVEPGIYFIDRLLSQAQNDENLKTRFNWEVIESYKKEIQAVRVEDMVHVTASGAELLTDNMPRTTVQIESCMATGQWE